MDNEPVLIVDDNPTNVRLTRLLLTGCGYEVRSAADSQEALQILREYHPHLILMDVQLPGMDGLELTRILKASPETKDCIIVALTAYAMPDDEQKAKDAGCDGYIPKPIDTRLFPAQIRLYLDRFDALRAAVQHEEPSVAPPAAGLSNDLLGNLRTEFVTAGVHTSRMLAESDPSGWNTQAIARTVHHWTGVGGTLGYPNVSERARQLERLIEANFDVEKVLAGFRELQDIFGGLSKDLNKSSLPVGIAMNLLGRKIALAGFGERESARLGAAFEQVAALPHNLGSMAEGLGLNGLLSYDLVVLNACTDEGIRSWTSLCSQPLLEKPFLLIVSRATLLDSKLDLGDKHSYDFVFAPWDVEELLFRAQRILRTRTNVAVKPVTKMKQTVVLADDDPTIHAILGPMFRKLDFDFYSVQDGSQALEMIKNLSPSVVILDIGMPKVSGMSVLTTMRRDPGMRRIPVLMLTARQQETDVSMALGFGANDYAIKPFDPLDVVTRAAGLAQKVEPVLAA